MGIRNYQVNQSIKVIFKATPGATSANMDVFDEADTLDATQSGAMTQIGSTNRWTKDFTPDANGDWSIEITDSFGAQVIKHYSVGNYNIDSIGADVATIDGKVDIIDAKIDGLQSPPMIG